MRKSEENMLSRRIRSDRNIYSKTIMYHIVIILLARSVGVGITYGRRTELDYRAIRRRNTRLNAFRAGGYKLLCGRINVHSLSIGSKFCGVRARYAFCRVRDHIRTMTTRHSRRRRSLPISSSVSGTLRFVISHTHTIEHKRFFSRRQTTI